MASCIQSVEESPDVDLGPAIVVALNDADTLGERQSRGDKERVAHIVVNDSNERTGFKDQS
jgi:hypothetical protein